MRLDLNPLLRLLSLGKGRRKTPDDRLRQEDFEELMGKDLPTWKYVQTKQDLEHLHLFKQVYDLRKGMLKEEHSEVRVPKSAHFIWLGPNPFPLKSTENVRMWMGKHPDWTFYFWTDRPRPLPEPGMQLRLVETVSFLKLKECFDDTQNWAEKSDVLRYEILYQEGGVYIDHDVACFRPFDAFNCAYDFYCGTDMPNTSNLPSCVFTTNNLIGVKPRHPILLSCMNKLVERWWEIGKLYPGADRDSTLNRVHHRTFWLFGEAVKERIIQEGNRDIVFPAYYFDAPSDAEALFARHQYAGLWHQTETPFEAMVRKRLMLLSKKSNRILLVLCLVTGLNLLVFIALFFFFVSVLLC